MTSDTTTSTGEVHYRLVDNDGAWSLYADDPSGSTRPIIEYCSEDLARVVLDHVKGGERTVIVPEVSVPVGFADTVAVATTRARALLEQVEALAELIGTELLPSHETVWEELGLPDGVPEAWNEATGFDELRTVMHTLGVNALACVGCVLFDQPVKFRPAWFVTQEVRRLTLKLERLGLEPSSQRAEVLQEMQFLGVPGAADELEIELAMLRREATTEPEPVS